MSPEEIADLWRRGDPGLQSVEKETVIRWAKPDEEAVVHTDERGPGRRLIKHPHSTVEELNVLRGEEYTTLGPEEVDEDDEVVGARLRLPIGALKVRRTPRDHAQHAVVVSDRIETDGGQCRLPAVGDRVVDREDGDRLVVINVDAHTTADEEVLPECGGLTVAELNPEYDATAPLVEAVYVETVDNTLQGWRSVEDLIDAVEFGALEDYTFPADRLGTVEEDGQ